MSIEGSSLMRKVAGVGVVIALTVGCAGKSIEPGDTPPWILDGPWANADAGIDTRTESSAIWSYRTPEGVEPGTGDLRAETFLNSFRRGVSLNAYLADIFEIQRERCEAFQVEVFAATPELHYYEAWSPDCEDLPGWEFVRVERGARGFHILTAVADAEPEDVRREAWISVLRAARLAPGR
jgi:hypothetical protein